MASFPPLRLGILGAARIAENFAAGVAESPLVCLHAVASRTPEKAAAFAARHGIARVHASYAELLADPRVEAVYVPLPNDMHAEWAIRAAEAGKHVLCEKPLCLTPREAEVMFAAARAHGVHLVEGYPYMSQPQTLELRRWLAEGAIGRVQVVNACLGFAVCAPDGSPLGDPSNIRLDPARGGGVLRDGGTYPMSLVRLVLGERPARVCATQRRTQSGVDMSVMATLDFPSGALAQISCTMATAFHRRAIIGGERGAIETDFSNDAPAEGQLTLSIRRGLPRLVAMETVSLPGGDGFRAEAESFARLVRLGATAWNGASEAESRDIVASLDAIARAAASGGWVTVEG